MKKNKSSFSEKMSVGGYYLSLAASGGHGTLAAASVVGAAAAFVLGVPVVGVLVGLAACNAVLGGMMLVMAGRYDRMRLEDNPLRPQPAFYAQAESANRLAGVPARMLGRAFARAFQRKNDADANAARRKGPSLSA